MRKPILRFKRSGFILDRVEVLSDGGKFVVQELPVTNVIIDYSAHAPGTVTLTMNADLVTITDPD